MSDRNMIGSIALLGFAALGIESVWDDGWTSSPRRARHRLDRQPLLPPAPEINGKRAKRRAKAKGKKP